MNFINDSVGTDNEQRNKQKLFRNHSCIAAKANPEAQASKTDQMNKLVGIPKGRHVFNMFLT